MGGSVHFNERLNNVIWFEFNARLIVEINTASSGTLQ